LPAQLDSRAPQLIQAEHMLRFMDALGIDSFHLLGHSLGGLIAGLMYLAQPDRVWKLVLAASSSVFHEGASTVSSVSGAHDNQLPALLDPTPEKIRKRNGGSNFNHDDGFDEIVSAQMTALAMPGRLEAFEWVTNGLKASASDPESRVVARLELF